MANRLVAHERFRAAYDFMILRCDAGDASAELRAFDGPTPPGVAVITDFAH